jgi:hypothetical protein
MMALGSFLVAVLGGLLWIGFVAPTILRALGVPMALGYWRLDRRNQRLTKWQYVWGFGVFSWGVGMFLFSAVWAYLFSKPIFYGFSRPTLTHLVSELVTWLAAGWLVGFFSAPRHNSSESPVR